MKEQNITVALRVRPINRREVRSGARPNVRVVDQNLVVLVDPNRDSDDILRAKRSHEHRYVFDVAFSQRATQRKVYEQTAQRLISKVISGYNATVFAYGPTGAGKTYTMLGKMGEPGIMALTLSDLFATMEENKESKYRVTMAYLEIYNETVRNLIGPSSSGILDLREDAHGATVVTGMTELEVNDSDEVMALLTRGNLRRTCEPTAVNKTSSRSHAILKVTVEQQSRTVNFSQKIRTGVLFMIDLAGSERAAITQNRGQRMKEGAHINRSLLALANCINTLSSGGQYVNYRDSKLTRLLKDALSGNCYTVMIAHISPASTSYEESKNTLKYADRVKHLKTKVSSNVVEVDQHVTEYRICMESMKARIVELERQLEWREGEGESLCQELRSLLKEEKLIREEMVSLEHKLLLNAVERQKHTTTIRLGVASTPSPLPPSSLSPLPTTLEDTGQASLLFERSSTWFTEPSHVIETSQSMEDIIDSSHMTTMETIQSDHMGTAYSAENELSSPDNHMVSPDSCLPTTEGEEGREEEESDEVATAREELVRLQMERRRLEARHRRLGRKLMETRTKKSHLQKRIKASGGLHRHQMELCTALQLCGELEEEGRQREMAAAQASLQLGRREVTLEGLLNLNLKLIAALRQYKTLLEAKIGSPPVGERLPPLEPLFSWSSNLTWQAERERRLPVAGRFLQLPTFSTFSARLCATSSTTMAGSKSNLLLVEDVTDGEAEEEEAAGPSLPDLGDVPSSLPLVSFPTIPLFPSAPITSTFPPASTSLVSPNIHHIHQSSSLPVVFPPSTSIVCQNNYRQCKEKFSDQSITKTTSAEHITSSDNTQQLVQIAPGPGPSAQITTKPTSSSVVAESSSIQPTTARRSSILSKVGFNAPRITASRSSTNKTKYVVESHVSPSITDETAEDGNGGLNEKKKNNITRDSDASKSTGESPNHEVTEEISNAAFTLPPATAAERDVKAGVKEEREIQVLSISQVSLTHSNHGGKSRTIEPIAKGGRKLVRPRQSSIPVVKATDQKTKRDNLSVRPPHQRRRQRERQPLVPSKVVAGSQVDASPYLKTTTASKSINKKIVFKKPSHPLPKFKSPYNVSLAKPSKTKK